MKYLLLGLLTTVSCAFLNAQTQLVREITPEKQNVLAFDISPDSEWLASGGDDNQVIFWDYKTGNRLFYLKGHKDWVTSLVFSDFKKDNQKYFASGARDGLIIVHEIEKRAIHFQTKAHEQTINDIVIISSLNYLAAVSSDGFMSIIDLTNKQLINKVKVSDNPVLGVTWKPESNVVLTSDADGKVKYWDVLTGNMEKVLDAHESYSRDLAIVDAHLITVGDDKSIKFWESENGLNTNTIEKAHKKWIQDVVPVGDGLHFATGGHDGLVKIWDINTLKAIYETKQNGTFVSGLAFSPDLKQLSTVGYGGNISIWDISLLGLKPRPKMVTTSVIAANRSSGQSSNSKSDKNEILMVQPVIEKGNTYWSLDEKIKLKGQILSTSTVKELIISNKTLNETDRLRLTDNSIFEHELPLRYKNNEIEIKATKVDGEVIIKTINVHRIFDQKNIDEMANLTRNGRDYALIFATNEYSDMNNLTNPVFDATTIAAELENNYGFEVEKVINPQLDEIKLKIKEYSKRLYADEDQLFIFIAGHGEYDELFKEGYLVATNSIAKDEARSSYLPHSTLRTYINNIPCEHIFLTMDVCFGGTFDPFIASRGTDAAKAEQVQKMLFVKRKLGYKSRIYITSGGKEYVPDGRPGHHSPFARKFLEALRTYGGSDGILSYKDIISSVETVSPEPRAGEFGDNEPGSDFLFIYR